MCVLVDSVCVCVGGWCVLVDGVCVCWCVLVDGVCVLVDGVCVGGSNNRDLSYFHIAITSMGICNSQPSSPT